MPGHIHSKNDNSVQSKINSYLKRNNITLKELQFSWDEITKTFEDFDKNDYGSVSNDTIITILNYDKYDEYKKLVDNCLETFGGYSLIEIMRNLCVDKYFLFVLLS